MRSLRGMHICFVCPYDLRRPGGVRTHIIGLGETLAARGHHVTLIGPSGGEEPRDVPLTVLDVGSGVRIPFSGTRIDLMFLRGQDRVRLKQFLSDERPDVVHFHTPWTPIFSLQLLRMLRGDASGRGSGRALRVATFHDTPSDSLWGRFLGRFVMPVAARFLMRCFDQVISVSPSQKACIDRYSSQTVHVIPNGFRFRLCPEAAGGKVPESAVVPASELLPAFAPAPEPVEAPATVLTPEPAEASATVETPATVLTPAPQPSTMLFLGRLEPRKGVLHALRVFELIKPRYPELKFIIAGSGPLEQDARVFVRQRGLTDVVFEGQVDERRKEKLLTEADLLLAPALYGESFGIVLLEAMAAGTPVAGYGNPGYAAVVHDYAPENFPNPGDVMALAARATVILSDEPYRSALIDRGFIHVKRYDWDQVADRIIELYTVI
jgi:phosphatidyl-myo-inositol alpha-mannosyltransferase